MHKLYNNVEKELEQIATTGINTGNLENTEKLVDIAKNIKKIEYYKEVLGQMRDYDRNGYRGDYRYDDRYMNERRLYDRDGDSYGRRGMPGSGRGRYMGNPRFEDGLNRIMDGMDMYEYGKERYRDSGDKDRMMEGLDKMMYAVCTFVESAMDFAESPQEKEIIRKHIEKMKAM